MNWTGKMATTLSRALLIKSCDIAKETIFFLHGIFWINLMEPQIRYSKPSAVW